MKKQALTKQDIQKELLTKLNKRQRLAKDLNETFGDEYAFECSVEMG